MSSGIAPEPRSSAADATPRRRHAALLAILAGHPLAALVNLVLPGAGLIAVQRTWLGSALLALFAVCGHLLIAAALVAPAAWPGWLIWLAGGLIVVVWGAAQFALYAQLGSRGNARVL